MSEHVVWVVAGALVNGADACLMHRRPYEKHHGGLWEFPGGKVEDAEIPVKALVRELREELGIVVDPGDCEAVGFAEDAGEQSPFPIVILLYRIHQWQGEPRALEGGRIAWFARAEVAELDKPPLDRVLAAQLFEKLSP
ncbi:(deoxy)nucleoside triphosphate pyrophosphohydrolase [Qipengyuania nanhaisediminis]|uniref:(deoxy)nucleoside triphosphate pyrophosphohydrolase n=1 Tax=Qipengyuania nanhaisediminis TaxID=604088 RepID=UPI0038B2FAB9